MSPSTCVAVFRGTGEDFFKFLAKGKIQKFSNSRPT